MDEDALKIVLFGGALAGVYLIARFARRISEQATITNSFQTPDLELPGPVPEPVRRSPGLVGSEIPFPFDVREVEAKYGPGVWRPIVLNYFFRETDLVNGPPDTEDFYDEFFVECENPETGYRWKTSWHVTTPKGIVRVMTEERTDHLFGDATLIVRRFDLRAILRAVMKNIIEANDPRLQDGGSNSPSVGGE